MYFTGGITNPFGMKGNQLVAGYNLVTASKNAIDNFVKCLSICRVKIRNIVATPYAAGLGCLTNDDFLIGTTVIDIGAGNTSIASFFDNKLNKLDLLFFNGKYLEGFLFKLEYELKKYFTILSSSE